MDFESEDWDVGTEASDLSNSLFQESKSKTSKKTKRKHEEEIKGLGKSSQESPAKKSKPQDHEKHLSKKSLNKDGKAEVEQMNVSRKEKRQIIWEQKMQQKRKKKENGSTESGTATGDSEVPDVKLSDPSVKGNERTSNVYGKPSEAKLTVKEKRRIKFDEWKKKKLQRDEKKLSSEVISDAGSSELKNAAKGSESNDKSGKEVTEVNTNTPQNKKEKKKLKRKLKLQEKRRVDESSSDKMKKLNVDNVDEKDSDERNVSLKSPKPKKNRTLKGNQKLLENMEENKNSPAKKKKFNVDTADEKEADENNVSKQSMKPKHKRKRVCKRNKFKGYVKPEKDGMRASETLENDTSSTSIRKGETTTVEEADSTKRDSPERKRKKTKKKDKSVGKETQGDVKQQVLPKKKNASAKKASLDPKALSVMFSKTTKTGDSSVDEVEVSGKDDAVVNSKAQKKSLLEKSWERLNAARFRYLNELLYTTTGKEALNMFTNDEAAFSVYHQGFQSQVEKWPTNPLDVIIEEIKTKPKHLVIADFGCGDAKLARSVSNKVHSFDLVALNDHVTVCDMSKVPLKDSTVDITVFCLSLMGTNLTSYLQEANRVLKTNGTLLVAEVTSRFNNIADFIKKIEKMGFKVKQQDTENKMFVMLMFKKTAPIKGPVTEEIMLKPCLYKKR